jgi:hypothetical protein
VHVPVGCAYVVESGRRLGKLQTTSAGQITVKEHLLYKKICDAATLHAPVDCKAARSRLEQDTLHEMWHSMKLFSKSFNRSDFSLGSTLRGSRDDI